MTPSRPILSRSIPSGTRIHVIAFAVLALVWATAAASMPPPTDAVEAAHAALTAAATPDGERYAAEELAAAHRQLDAAQAAMAKRDYKQARELAEEAQADADLARAKARALATRAAIESKTQDNAELQHRLLDQEPLDQQPSRQESMQQEPLQQQQELLQQEPEQQEPDQQDRIWQEPIRQEPEQRESAQQRPLQ